MKPRHSIVAMCSIFMIGASTLSAQTTPVPADTTAPLRVFIDCPYSCDLDFIRTEMPWVDYMNDRADAQVHVLVTQEGTGGGGSQYTLNFIGLREFVALNDTLKYTSTSEDSQDATRRGLTRMIQLGLMPFIARTPHGRRMKVSMESPTAGAATAVPAKRDPWNYWNFRLGFNGQGNGESRSDSKHYSGNISASRTTEEWKSSIGINSSQNLQSVTYPTPSGRDTTERFFSRSSSIDGSLTKSLGQHFSAGMTASLSTSTYGNIELSTSIKPAVEYDFFPYKESNRRMLTAQYSIGMRSFDYQDTTIYLKTKETVPQHSLSLGYSTQEPWGSANLYASYSQYLHDTDFFNTGIGGSTDVRLFKGFSFNIFGDYSMVRDQLSLQKGKASQADVLLRQREQATNFRYFIGMGLSYRFGSIFNNVVNPRMGGGGGGGRTIIFF
ncbi:MAG: hypothetical protein ABIV28_09060 [Longimicrobiales bacterium]